VDFSALEGYLRRVPSVRPISTGMHPDGLWWAKLGIDIEHPLAWRVVQELGHVLNHVTLDFSPAMCAEWLEGRLPRPVDHLQEWEVDDG
jgi:hypothetical protein